MSREVFGGTDKGLVRPNNQDRFKCEVINDNMGFGVVCDGMGGENGGGKASEIACEYAFKTLHRDLSYEMTELSVRAIFSSIFSGANALVYEASQKNKDLKGMGTTMVIAVIKDHQLFIGSVGDSRAYVFNEKEGKQVTKDHTVVQMMVDMGEISEQDAVVHPKKHFITRAVGVSETVDMDFYVEDIKDGDIAFLCSDGLYTHIDFDNMYQLLKKSVDTKSADILINAAKDDGGFDNITAVVMV